MWLAGFTLVVLSLAGCKSLVTMPSLQTSTPEQWRNSVQATSESNSTQAPDLDAWWHAFGDPQLDALITQALSDNLSVAQAREHLVAARALASVSTSEFRPNINAGTLTTPDPDATASYLQVNIDARWELGLFGRTQSTQWVAQAGVDSAAADLQSSRVTLVAEVVRDYLALRGAQQQVTLLEQVADAQRKHQALTQRRRELGLATDADLARTEADAAQADAALSEPRARADSSAQQLALLCGIAEPQPALLAAAPMPNLLFVVPRTLPADLLRTRPDIHRAESAVLSAAGELGIAKADLYPRLSLLGGITTSTTTSGGTFGFGRAVPAIGPIIDFPLFDWGARRARVTAKDAELLATVYAYRQTVLEAVAETESALSMLDAQQARMTSLRTAVAAHERDAHSTARARNLGLADDVDQAVTAVALIQSQLELLDAEQARNLAYIALYKSLGGAPPPAATATN